MSWPSDRTDEASLRDDVSWRRFVGEELIRIRFRLGVIVTLVLIVVIVGGCMALVSVETTPALVG